MVSTKIILVLANSVKHYPCTCIAGREIRPRNTDYTIVQWVRPVSSHDEGGIAPGEARLNNGQQPSLGDFIEIPFSKPTDDRLQPENWLISPQGQWRAVNSAYQKPGLNLLVESPQNLWLQPNEETDRVTTRWLQRNPPAQSLYLIHVPAVRVRFGWKQWDGQYKARRRALFTYLRVAYDIGITDPVFLEKYRNQFPAKGERANEFEVASRGGCCLCVSLAPEYNGSHYKVIATIIEA